MTSDLTAAVSVSYRRQNFAPFINPIYRLSCPILWSMISTSLVAWFLSGKHECEEFNVPVIELDNTSFRRRVFRGHQLRWYQQQSWTLTTTETKCTETDKQPRQPKPTSPSTPVKPISQLRFDYDMIPWRIQLLRKWSKLRYAFDSTAYDYDTTMMKTDMFIICLRRTGSRRARYVVVGSQL